VAGDAASLVSLLVTSIVAWQVRTIKKSLLAKTRIPETIRDLRKATEALLESMKEWPKYQHEALRTVEQVDGILMNITAKLSGAEKRKVTASRHLIRTERSSWSTPTSAQDDRRKDGMWSVYNSLVGTVEVLDQLNKDNKKRV
jgi:hypothetical protein